MGISRDTFGNIVVVVFVLLLLAIFTQVELTRQILPLTKRGVLLPALYHTGFVLGGWVCAVIAALQLTKKRRSK